MPLAQASSHRKTKLILCHPIPIQIEDSYEECFYGFLAPLFAQEDRRRFCYRVADLFTICIRAKGITQRGQMKAAGAVAKIATLPLTNGVRLLMGADGNILVLPGADGILAVDGGLVTSQPQIARDLSELSAGCQ